MKLYTAADFQTEMQTPDPRAAELSYLKMCLGSVTAILAQRQPLTGLIFTEQGPMDVADAVTLFVAGPVLHRFGTWVVTQDGIACLVHQYPLTQARLHEQEDWANHLAEQSWVNLWDLLRAMMVARQAGFSQQQDGPQGDGAQPS
ncbi:MAG: hypothetical protein M3R24_29105 [Chloroflexota bacterium]|nr:hypothetical protein [Chloroflexota bacterium]